MDLKILCLTNLFLMDFNLLGWWFSRFNFKEGDAYSGTYPWKDYGCCKLNNLILEIKQILLLRFYED